MKVMIGFLVALFLSVGAEGAVKTEFIDYKQGGTILQGYLAYDDAVKGKRPGVLIVHPWKGRGDYVHMRARQLAEMGYVAFALDMYGKGVYAKDHKEAAALSGTYKKDRALMRRRSEAGLTVLKKQSKTDKKRLAAIGYCFGGTTVIEMARAGMDLEAVVSFHPAGMHTIEPDKTKSVKAKIQVHHGANDAYNPEETIKKFQDEMNRVGADWQINVYSGAVHSFTMKAAGDDPSKGSAYQQEADRRSWKAMQDLFNEVF